MNITVCVRVHRDGTVACIVLPYALLWGPYPRFRGVVIKVGYNVVVVVVVNVISYGFAVTSQASKR